VDKVKGGVKQMASADGQDVKTSTPVMQHLSGPARIQGHLHTTVHVAIYIEILI